MNTRKQIEDFLGCKRLAVVGVSSNPRDFSRALFSELRRRHYDVVPVNPRVTEVDGIPCHSNVKEIAPPVEGALLMTKPAVTDQVVRDCIEAGIRSLWFFRATGSGAVSPDAVKRCQSSGINVVGGECPFMFLPETSWIHRAHGFCRKVTGRYPK